MSGHIWFMVPGIRGSLPPPDGMGLRDTWLPLPNGMGPVYHGGLPGLSCLLLDTPYVCMGLGMITQRKPAGHPEDRGGGDIQQQCPSMHPGPSTQDAAPEVLRAESAVRCALLSCVLCGIQEGAQGITSETRI